MKSSLHVNCLAEKSKTMKFSRRLLTFPFLFLYTFLTMGPFSSLFAQVVDPSVFITTWETTAESPEITIPINPTKLNYNYSVDWGDGTSISLNQSASATHTYAAPGEHTVTISGSFPAIQFGGTQSDNQNDAKLIRVDQWGTAVWEGMDQAFEGCINLTTVSATDAPVFAANSTLFKMFMGCNLFNSNLNNWNITPVRETSYMFYKAAAFNGNISNWDMSNVTNTQYMFARAIVFNQNISGWQMGSLTRMDYMFMQASAFNQNIGAWDVSGVQFIDHALEDATTFDQNLGNWDISSLTDMTYLLNQSGMSQNNYDATLIGWAAKNVNENVTVGANGLSFCGGSAARASLIDDHHWVFLGDVNVCSVTAQPDVNGIVYVDSSIATPGNGSSWAAALKYVSDGLTAANNDLTIKEIHVAKGTYYPAGLQSDGDRSRSFVITRGDLHVLGDYPTGGGSRIQDGSQRVILSGDINVAGDSTDNSWHVMVIAGVDILADSLIIDGFTISGGNANLVTNQTYNGVIVPSNCGGGLSCQKLGSNTVIRNCIIENNTSNFFGGGLYISEANTRFSHLTIQNNHSNYGGGVFLNSGSAAHLSDLTIVNNRADGPGGGLFSQTNSAAVLVGAVISGNQAVEGGGIANQGAGVYYYNVQVTGNLAAQGGGVSDNHSVSHYTNATISGNKATDKGGGVYVEFATVRLINSIIYNNVANESNEMEAGGGSGNSTTLLYCNISDGPNDISIATEFKDYGSTVGNPLFVQPLDPQSAPQIGGNYALMDGSPAIDAGFNDSIPAAVTATDLMGKARIYHGPLLGVVDLGAIESELGKIITADNNGILYVDSSIAVGGNGSSWTEALRQLSTATKLANLKTAITEIHVAKGTYYPTGSKSDTTRRMSFSINRGGLKLMGGYPGGGGSRDILANPTILSGNINVAGDSTDNSLRVVTIKGIEAITDSVVLDGFTITGGYANSGVRDFEVFGDHTQGAGVFIYGDIGPGVAIRNCYITRNYAFSGGGLWIQGLQTRSGLYIMAAPTIQHCQLDGNGLIPDNGGSSNFPAGGGIGCVTANPVLDNCSISNNVGSVGAAISSYLLSKMTIRNSIITGNEGHSFPVLVNFFNSTTSFVNCLIYNNTGLIDPGQPNTPIVSIANGIGSQLRLINSTVVNNYSPMTGGPGNCLIQNQGASSLYVTNSIVWGNSGDFFIDDATGETKLAYSLIQGQVADPSRFLLDGTQAQDVFVDSANGNFQLKEGAIAIDAGLNDSIQTLATIDLTGNARINAQAVDLGAFEFLDLATPVKMSPLVGVLDEKQHAILSWKTYTETGNKGFDVLRSEDGIHFVKAGFVPSKAVDGNSQSVVVYRFDAGLMNKPVYFRINQIDLSGQPAYSNIIHLQPGEASNELLVYPNPARNVLNIQTPAAAQGLHPHIFIVDLSGRVVLRKQLRTMNEKVNVAHLSAGIYLLKYTDDKKSSVVRFIKK